MQASVALAHERGSATAYLPLEDLRDMSPDVLDGMAALDVLALDDVGAVAGDAAWERALFRLYEGLVPRGGRLLVAAEAPPAQAGFALPDLGSRLAAGAVFRLEQLSDAECLLALQRRAEWRGFALPDETAEFLLARVERGTGSLFRLLDRLDRAALAAQKRLTIPFVTLGARLRQVTDCCLLVAGWRKRHRRRTESRAARNTPTVKAEKTSALSRPAGLVIISMIP